MFTDMENDGWIILKVSGGLSLQHTAQTDATSQSKQA